MNPHETLLMAAHQIQKKTGELPIILNQELYHYMESPVRIVDINVYPAGVRCTIEATFGTLTVVEKEELELRQERPRKKDAVAINAVDVFIGAMPDHDFETEEEFQESRQEVIGNLKTVVFAALGDVE